MKNPTLQFLGAAQSVTGSKFLLRANGHEVLIDCGLFQGKKKLRKRNWNDLPIDPAKVDAILLTHAHIDHTGSLPRLVRQGYKGRVICTPASHELLEVMLPDSGRIQEHDAEYANLKGYSKHRPALPLYTEEDARRALRLIKAVDYRKEIEVAPGIHATFHPSGHILGAAFIELAFEGRRVVFSGDIGSYDRIVMDAPDDIPPNIDYVLTESTYGGRSQSSPPVQDQLRDEIKPVLERKGIVIIPAFAVGRTTLLLYHLRQLQMRGEIADVPVYVDSPMATDATTIYCKYGDEHNLKVDLLRSSEDCPIRARTTHLVRKSSESRELNRHPGPAIIISSSGMITGGRVVHHVKHHAPNEKNLILLVGYQAYGTRGRRLLEGEKSIRMFGRDIPVRAKVASIRGLSAHGDCDDMIAWLKSAPQPPKKTFLVHGEMDALREMGSRVTEELGYAHHTPDYMETVAL